MDRNYKRGFSLIEALVILLVTAILMAVMVPWLTVKKQAGSAEKWAYTNNLNIYLGSTKASNNVGIGTTSPRARLHVVSAKQITTNDVADARQQEKGADMIIESTTRAPILAFVLEQRPNNVSYLYMNSEHNNIGFGEESFKKNIENAILNNEDYKETKENIGIGVNALKDLNRGVGNLALGVNTLMKLQTGNRNTAIGAYAMESCINNTSDNVVVATGHESMGDSLVKGICGNNNTFLGKVGIGDFKSSDNIFIDTGIADNSSGGAKNMNGSTGNVFIGTNITKPTGINGVAPGNGAGYLNIGNRIVGRFSPNDGNFDKEDLYFTTTNFNIRTNNRTKGFIYYRNNVTGSDIRLKENIKPYTRSIEELARLKTYNFFYKGDNKKGPLSVGIIAQDVLKVMPEAVFLDENNKYAVNYAYINMAMVNAVKDIKKENDELSAELDMLEKQINESSTHQCSCKKVQKKGIFERLLSFIGLK